MSHSQQQPDPQRVIVTGVSGTLGHHILMQLAGRKDLSVLALHRSQSHLSERFPGVRYEAVDFFDKGELARIFTRFDPTTVIHCAATGMVFPKLDWFELIRFNVSVSLDLIELASKLPSPSGACHFIYVSTGLAYRDKPKPSQMVESDPLDTAHPYGASKAAADLLLRSAAVEFGVPLTVFRPFSFTGIGDTRTRLFPSLLRAAATGETLDLSPGNQVRDHCPARDIVTGMLAALERIPPVREPAIYNLGSGEAIPLRPLIEGIVEELGLPVRLHFGARPYGNFEPMNLVADIGKARECLGWRPEHRLAHAVWELAETSFPTLRLKQPRETLSSL